MTKTIKLVATDLDGTLLHPDGSISPRTKAALAAADAAGLLIAFVTGRPPRWLDDVVEASGHRGVAVGSNGAVLYDLETEQIISARTLDPATVLRRSPPSSERRSRRCSSQSST